MSVAITSVEKSLKFPDPPPISSVGPGLHAKAIFLYRASYIARSAGFSCQVAR
jgi:hypothetical protein